MNWILCQCGNHHPYGSVCGPCSNRRKAANILYDGVEDGTMDERSFKDLMELLELSDVIIDGRGLREEVTREQ